VATRDSVSLAVSLAPPDFYCSAMPSVAPAVRLDPRRDRPPPPGTATALLYALCLQGVPVVGAERGCAPSPTDRTQIDPGWNWANCSKPFYLDESTPGLSHSQLAACYRRKMGLTDPDDMRLDDHIEPERVQHVADMQILHLLRNHPARVYDPDAAAVHFTGVLPTISHYIQTDLGNNYCGFGPGSLT